MNPLTESRSDENSPLSPVSNFVANRISVKSAVSDTCIRIQFSRKY